MEGQSTSFAKKKKCLPEEFIQKRKAFIPLDKNRAIKILNSLEQQATVFMTGRHVWPKRGKEGASYIPLLHRFNKSNAPHAVFIS